MKRHRRLDAPAFLEQGSPSKLRRMRYGASVLALAAVASLTPALAMAQSGQTDDADEDAAVSEVVVTGVRQSLKSAQQIKRDADTVVDSITATDIGSFPDKSVAEALQRVAGITVNRFAATSDTAHFSAEPSGVIVRGLQQVRSEFNGRDIFSANSSRGLGWGDVSPELMARVDTYKNQTAELIEGGIAGTIDLRTRVPFDQPGSMVAGTIQMNYGDISKKITPDASVLFSNRWGTDMGEFGLLANFAYSKVQTASEGIQYGRMGIFEGVFGTGTKYIPSSVAYRDNVYDRERKGASLAAQWQDNDGKFVVTAQYNRSQYDNVWHEYVVSASPFDLYALPTTYTVTPATSPSPVLPAPGTPAFTFDSEGNFQTGVMTSDIGWWGNNNAESALVAANSAGQALINACYGWNGCEPARRGGGVSTTTRYNQNRQITEDASINVKWNPSDRLRVNFDLQKVKSSVDNYDISVDHASYANIGLDATGDHPVLTLTPGTNINLAPGGLSNANAYRYHSVMDHIEDSDGEEFAVRADAQYMFESDWLDSLKVGVRFADRDQTVRWSAYNWQNIANTWCQNAGFYNIDRHTPALVDGDCNGGTPPNQFTGYPQGLYGVRSFDSDFFGGGLVNPSDFVFFNMDVLEDHGAISKALGQQFTGVGSWRPICTRPDEVDGCFRRTEIADVSEETKAAYVMLKFGGSNAEIGGIGVSGNLGIRYVETTNESAGAVQYPRPFTSAELLCEPRSGDGGQPIVGAPNTSGCYISPQQIQFAAGGGLQNTAVANHKHWLPSFNVKLDLTDQWLLRFAASRAMARPDIGYLKNYVAITTSLANVNNLSDPRWILNAAGQPTGMQNIFTADAYNPYLKPTTADQFDLSLERYFADVGSFSVAVFYKQFHDYIQYGAYNMPVTINGVTQQVRVRGPVNGEGAKIQGFEVSYQRFFDFLPDPFNGFGVQANFTYVKNKGITNTNLTAVSNDGNPGTTGGGLAQVTDSIEVDALEGVSEKSYNIIAMYEKGRWAARAAYNWRSEFLVTAVDCCVYFPIWQEAAGFLDASIRYRVNDQIELNLQGSNLLNTETVLKQQVEDASSGGRLTPNAWFRNDRRVQFGLRFKY